MAFWICERRFLVITHTELLAIRYRMHLLCLTASFSYPHRRLGGLRRVYCVGYALKYYSKFSAIFSATYLHIFLQGLLIFYFQRCAENYAVLFIHEIDDTCSFPPSVVFSFPKAPIKMKFAGADVGTIPVVYKSADYYTRAAATQIASNYE